jgi:hypothetical protein
MDSQLLQFLGSLAAVSALVALTYILGFRSAARLESEHEARELFRLAAGGFEPVEIALDADHAGAIARNAEGRLAVLVPHGNQFVVRCLDPATAIEARDGQLLIAGLPNVMITLGERSRGWATTDIDANSA